MNNVWFGTYAPCPHCADLIEIPDVWVSDFLCCSDSCGRVFHLDELDSRVTGWFFLAGITMYGPYTTQEIAEQVAWYVMGHGEASCQSDANSR